MAPVPIPNRITQVMSEVTFESAMVEKAVKAHVNGLLHPATVADLFTNALVDQHVRIHRHAQRQDDTGDARQGHGGPWIIDMMPTMSTRFMVSARLATQPKAR